MPAEPTGAAESDGPRHRVAVLVRSHNPTAAAVARIAEWSGDLAGVRISLFVSMDVTHGEDAAERVRAALPRGSVHCYDEAQLLEDYPHLAEVRLSMVGEDKWAGLSPEVLHPGCPPVREAVLGLWRVWAGGEKSSIAWGFHAEAVDAWLRRVAVKDSADAERTAEAPFDYLWVLEDDVGFSGSLASFVLAYKDNSADLISDLCAQSHAVSDVRLTASTNPRSIVSWAGWCWHDTCTQAYRELIPGEKRFSTREHVQRFSLPLLRELGRLCRSGIGAWSEQFSISACHHFGFVYAPISDEHLPEENLFSHRGRVDEDMFRDALVKPEMKNKLYHALKW